MTRGADPVGTLAENESVAVQQGSEPDGVDGRVGRLFGLQLATAGRHCDPVAETRSPWTLPTPTRINQIGMWSHCIVCAAGLGENEDVEAFPIGQRLAYDASKGRLWVVCPQCGRWNLTPLEERWEAVEVLERLWEQTTSRAATEHIALGSLPSGMRIVRVGKSAAEREYAFWRWGRRGASRYLKPVVYGGVALVGVVAGLTVLPPVAAAVGVAMSAHASLLAYLYRQGLMATGMVDHSGNTTVLKRHDLLNAGMNPRDDDLGWSIHLQRAGYTEVERPFLWTTQTQREQHFYWTEYTGSRAQAIARRAFPVLNARHATDAVVTDAMSLIAAAGGPGTYLRTAAAQKPRWVKFRHYPTPMRLALEMVLFEEDERRALEGELQQLEGAWREAEDLAAISDNLIEPAGWANEKARLRRLASQDDSPDTRRLT